MQADCGRVMNNYSHYPPIYVKSVDLTLRALKQDQGSRFFV